MDCSGSTSSQKLGISEDVIFMKTQEYLHAKSEYSTDDYIQWLVDDFEKLITISEINFQKNTTVSQCISRCWF